MNRRLPPLLLLGACALLILSEAGCASGSRRPLIGSSLGQSPPGVFLSEVEKESLGEVQLGQAALERASDPRVKEFARKAVDEDQAMLQDLKATASTQGVTLPETLDQDQTRVIGQIASRRGADFDRHYLACLVADEESKVAAFEEQARSAASPEVRSFASRQLPVLKERLRRARELEKSLTTTPPLQTAPPGMVPGAAPEGGRVLG
jgi:putative membrane protein